MLPVKIFVWFPLAVETITLDWSLGYRGRQTKAGQDPRNSSRCHQQHADVIFLADYWGTGCSDSHGSEVYQEMRTWVHSSVVTLHQLPRWDRQGWKLRGTPRVRSFWSQIKSRHLHQGRLKLPNVTTRGVIWDKLPSGFHLDISLCPSHFGYSDNAISPRKAGCNGPTTCSVFCF